LVTYVVEPKSGSQEVGTRSNPDLMDVRGEGGNGLTLREFWSFEPLISTLLSGGMDLVFFFITSAPFF